LVSYTNSEKSLACCGQPTEYLFPKNASEIAHLIEIDYKIVGGFNQNAVEVSWRALEGALKPEWILLKTFTGGYIKYLTSEKRSPMVFPLADEDAYVYCDRKVCQRCVFRCKKGFVICVYMDSLGLYQLPLDKMSDYFKI
jgi:hypothetical protein